jgi:nuclear transport factor 2 (NTF2) superfamily protein
MNQPGESPALGIEEARGIVKQVETLFARGDIPGIVAGFAPDAVVRFGDFPEMTGREAIERFIRARFARQKNYRLQKHLRMVMGTVIGNDWDAQWEDGKTGKPMRGRGMEFWEMRGTQIARWDAVFNVWEEGGKPSIEIV